MINTKLFGIIATTVVVSALLGVTMISESESQPSPFPTDIDVIHLGCGFSFGPQTFTVAIAVGSANTPAIAEGAGTNCSQTLADLIDAGFTIENEDLTGIFSYRLER